MDCHYKAGKKERFCYYGSSELYRKIFKLLNPKKICEMGKDSNKSRSKKPESFMEN